MKQNLIELGEIDKCTLIIGGFQAPFSVIDEKRRQNVSKVIEDLKNIYQPTFRCLMSIFWCSDVNDLYRTLHPTRAKYVSSSSTHERSPR